MGEGLEVSAATSLCTNRFCTGKPQLSSTSKLCDSCATLITFACSGVRGGALLDDAALLNTDTMTWSSLDVQQGDRPGPRRSHAAAGLPGRVCTSFSTAIRAVGLFYGALSTMRTVSASLLRLAGTSTCGAPTAGALQHHHGSRLRPAPVLRKQVIVFGGCGAEAQLLADFWALNVGKAQWTDLRQEAASLANRFATLHCSGAVHCRTWTLCLSLTDRRLALRRRKVEPKARFAANRSDAGTVSCQARNDCTRHMLQLLTE